jgi:hypothetical protein
MRRLLPILALAGLGAAIKFLPWWGILALVVGGALCVKLFAWKLLEQLMLGAFRAKGAALAGADATLHGITNTQPPKPAEDSESDASELEASGPLRWVHIDLTVHVPEDNGGKTPFRFWDPTELRLVPVDTQSGPPPENEPDLASIAGVERWDDGRWVTLEEKLAGTQRIRIHAGVKSDVEFFKLRYYFEIIENRETRASA